MDFGLVSRITNFGFRACTRKMSHHILEYEKSVPGFLCVHAKVVRHDVVRGCLQLVVSHVLLGLFDGRHVCWVLVVVIWLVFVKLIPLETEIKSGELEK